MKHHIHNKPLKKFLKKEWFNISLVAGVLLLSAFLGGRSVLAEDMPHPTTAEKKATNLMIAAMTNSLVDYGTLPESEKRKGIRTMTVVSTAYSSDVWQTDSTPFTTASGSTVRHGVLAANFLPIGTKVKIPALYGDEFFVVEDRMNARYTNRVDLWMETYQEAKQYGVRRIQIEIYDGE